VSSSRTDAPGNGRLERRPTRSLRPHPLAGELPPLSADEYAALKNDIAERGVQVPLEVTEEGIVLDGHARLQAARQLGHADVEVLLVAAADPLQYMLQARLLRLHLDASQRAALAVKLVDLEQLQTEAVERQQANLRRGAEQPVAASLPARGDDAAVDGRTRDRIAALAGVSARTVQDALTVHEHDADAFKRVLNGTTKVSTAASQIRRARRDAALKPAGPIPKGPYGLILADPPWQMGSPDSPHSPEQHYPCMTLDDIKALEVPAADDCLLLLWSVNQLLPQALEVIEAWGFSYRANLVWVKDKPGLGNWFRQEHETLLLAIKGAISPPDRLDRISSVLQAPRTHHSEKPKQLYQLIEQMYPNLPKLELFAREPPPGWASWGNQLPPSDQPANAPDPPAEEAGS
jgi:N6-adenosine-specific RNA methylase IME4/ParB-like chromosome segregation protein Spo0J